MGYIVVPVDRLPRRGEAVEGGDEVDQEGLPYHRSSWNGGPDMPPGVPGPPNHVLHRRHLKRFEAYFDEARLWNEEDSKM